MTIKQATTQTMVLDAISRAALTLDVTDDNQAGLQQLLNEFRRTLLQMSGEQSTSVLYQGRIMSYLLQHPATYPETVNTLTAVLAQFVKQLTQD